MAIAAFAFTSCSSTPSNQSSEAGQDGDLMVSPATLQSQPSITSLASDQSAGPMMERPRRQSELFPGTGHFINAGAVRPVTVNAESGDVTLNFHGAEIRDVIKTLLGELLKENFVVDSAVQGKVYLETSRPLSRDALIPALESVLRMNGAVLVQHDGLYEVLPDSAAGAHLAPTLSIDGKLGSQVLLVPLRYVAAAEMRKILEPFKPSTGQIAIDEARNLLIISGSQSELANLRRTVNIFDVDQFKGMSVGLYPLTNVSVQTLLIELKQVLGMEREGGIGDMVRLVSVERLNALLAITPQPSYLGRVETWVKRLDRTVDADGIGLHVYQVQNGSAEHLADVLSQLYGDAVQVEGRGKGAAGSNKSIASSGYDNKREAKGDAAKPLSAVVRASASSLDVGPVKIIADSENNALVIKASADDYGKIERAIVKLDVMPLQVLVEASIVEVRLVDEFSYGLEWYLEHSGLGGFHSGTATLDLNDTAGIAPQVPGFAYTITDTAGVIRGLLNTLAGDSKLHVVSSPSLMVLDNHTATINVGEQVPVRTSESSSAATPGDAAVIVSQIQFRDTGVRLEVTPRVNAGGMVIMDITQEVSNVAKTESSSIDSPTISQRQIRTSVAVQNRDTIVLGGLIQDDKQSSDSGVPFLRSIPIIGWLFGGGSRNSTRTELLVLITPTAVRDGSEARSATEELKQKMKGLQLPPVETQHTAPQPAEPVPVAKTEVRP